MTQGWGMAPKSVTYYLNGPFLLIVSLTVTTNGKTRKNEEDRKRWMDFMLKKTNRTTQEHSKFQVLFFARPIIHNCQFSTRIINLVRDLTSQSWRFAQKKQRSKHQQCSKVSSVQLNKSLLWLDNNKKDLHLQFGFCWLTFLDQIPGECESVFARVCVCVCVLERVFVSVLVC